MRTTYLLFSILFLSFPLLAQLRITGHVKDADSGAGLPGVAVQLFDKDSAFVEGAVTNGAGSFTLRKGMPGSLYLVLSSVGYTPNGIRLENVREHVKLGDLFLEPAAEQLEEVLVTASRTVQQVNRQIIYPSSMQRQSSATALELLGKMMLPDLLVNTSLNTVSSLNNGNVQLRINNVKAEVQDILAILSSQVAKVEYIDLPGARYGEGVAAVVNFVTSHAEEGLSGGINLKQAVTTGFGNDNLFLKYNRAQSEFTLAYDLSYRSFDDHYSTIRQEMTLSDGSLRTLSKTGIESPFKQQVHNVALSYNWLDKERSVLNVKLSNSLQRAPYYQTVQRIRESGTADLLASTGIRDKTVTPVLNLYYQLNLPAGQTLMTNLVGTYISTDYGRTYAERPMMDGVPPLESAYTVTGDKYSAIGELIYEKHFGERLLWSSGVNYKQSYLENRYAGSTGEVTTAMDNSDLYLYSEVDGRAGKFSYNVGLGFSRQYFKENRHKYTYYSFRPKVTLLYAFSSRWQARYAFSLNPMLPQLARLSDVSQWQNAYEVLVGNPTLKPYRAYMNSFSLRYSTGRLSIQLAGYHQYNPKPIMMDIVQRQSDGTKDYFVYRYANQKSFKHLQGRLYIGYALLPDHLEATSYLGVNRYSNRGLEYRHRFTHTFGGVTLNGMYKQFVLSASYRSRITNLFGETRNHSAAEADVSLTYRWKKNLRIGVGLLNPFFQEGDKSGQTLSSALMKKETWDYTRDLGNMCYLTLSWNFQWGRRHQAGRTRLYNADFDSGVVK